VAERHGPRPRDLDEKGFDARTDEVVRRVISAGRSAPSRRWPL